MNKFSTHFRWLYLTVGLLSSSQIAIIGNSTILNPRVVLAARPIAQVIEIPRAENVNYERYYNSRFNYSLLYPTNILVKQQAPENDDGRTFTSPDRKIIMKVFGSHNVFDKNIQNLYREELNQPNQTVTYKRLADNWFVISGYENNRVFYNKTLLHQGDVLTLSIDYDKALQSKFDPIVAAISRSFQASP
jgi:serine/threonine-protein kinase